MKKFHSGEQVFEHYIPGYVRPGTPEPTPEEVVRKILAESGLSVGDPEQD